MSDDEPTLAQRISSAVDAHEQEGWITTGFVLVTTAIHPDGAFDGTAGYGYTSAEGQSIHATRGLLEMGRTYYGNHTMTQEGDE